MARPEAPLHDQLCASLAGAIDHFEDFARATNRRSAVSRACGDELLLVIEALSLARARISDAIYQAAHPAPSRAKRTRVRKPERASDDQLELRVGRGTLKTEVRA